jgi:hypothetical protein
MGVEFWLPGLSSPDIWTMHARVGIADCVRIVQVANAKKVQIRPRRRVWAPTVLKDRTSSGGAWSAGPAEQVRTRYSDEEGWYVCGCFVMATAVHPDSARRSLHLRRLTMQKRGVATCSVAMRGTIGGDLAARDGADHQGRWRI